jgi:hypothetical protein
MLQLAIQTTKHQDSKGLRDPHMGHSKLSVSTPIPVNQGSDWKFHPNHEFLRQNLGFVALISLVDQFTFEIRLTCPEQVTAFVGHPAKLVLDFCFPTPLEAEDPSTSAGSLLLQFPIPLTQRSRQYHPSWFLHPLA